MGNACMREHALGSGYCTTNGICPLLEPCHSLLYLKESRPEVFVGPSTRLRNLLHLCVGHIIPERPVLLPSLDSLPHSRRHKLGVYPYSADEIQVGLEAS